MTFRGVYVAMLDSSCVGWCWLLQDAVLSDAWFVCAIHDHTACSFKGCTYESLMLGHEEICVTELSYFTSSSLSDNCRMYRSDGVTLIGFDSFLQITLVVETLSF